VLGVLGGAGWGGVGRGGVGRGGAGWGGVGEHSGDWLRSGDATFPFGWVSAERGVVARSSDSRHGPVCQVRSHPSQDPYHAAWRGVLPSVHAEAGGHLGDSPAGAAAAVPRGVGAARPGGSAPHPRPRSLSPRWCIVGEWHAGIVLLEHHPPFTWSCLSLSLRKLSTSFTRAHGPSPPPVCMNRVVMFVELGGGARLLRHVSFTGVHAAACVCAVDVRRDRRTNHRLQPAPQRPRLPGSRAHAAGTMVRAVTLQPVPCPAQWCALPNFGAASHCSLSCSRCPGGPWGGA
jgi:hypothetical protein